MNEFLDEIERLLNEQEKAHSEHVREYIRYQMRRRAEGG